MNAYGTIHPLSTGVPGLDAILGDGVPEYSFNLTTGPPGSGKTTLAHQIMFSLAKRFARGAHVDARRARFPGNVLRVGRPHGIRGDRANRA